MNFIIIAPVMLIQGKMQVRARANRHDLIYATTNPVIKVEI
jgi:hypothetical protein